ncbi:MAG: class I SAM-dependent methyltransferase, partial [Thermodesulfobacteriota bacterium]|nr:class I SAM-dependent methyltransferase [Thermodesulfobacteriota bacterium]
MLTVDFDLMEIHNKDYILDIGCGKGRHIWEACKRGIFKAYAVDIDREGLRNAKGMLEYMEEAGEVNGKWCVLEGNVMNLPFKDGFFDKIICSEMLEHVTDDHEGVKELYRV